MQMILWLREFESGQSLKHEERKKKKPKSPKYHSNSVDQVKISETPLLQFVGQKTWNSAGVSRSE